MKLMAVDMLKGNEKLGRAVMTKNYRELLAAGTVLKPEYIEKLKELDIKEVYIKCDEKYYKKVDILKKEVEDTVKLQVKNIIEKHTYAHNEKLMQLNQAAESIISNILSEKEVIERVYDIKERSADIYEHSISTTSLAILIALKMSLSHEDIHDIGVACLLHDIGLRYLTIDYLNKEIEDMNEAEKAEYKKHSIYGYSTLKNEWWISGGSKEIILSHHETLDGCGFPLHLTDISIPCRIVSVCDTFDEMICGIGRKRKKVWEAVEYLKTYKGIKYDTGIVEHLLEFTAVYPAGTTIITGKNEEAIVISQNKEFPDKPVIKLLKDSHGNKVLNEVIIDLSKVDNVSIKDVID